MRIIFLLIGLLALWNPALAATTGTTGTNTGEADLSGERKAWGTIRGVADTVDELKLRMGELEEALATSWEILNLSSIPAQATVYGLSMGAESTWNSLASCEGSESCAYWELHTQAKKWQTSGMADDETLKDIYKSYTSITPSTFFERTFDNAVRTYAVLAHAPIFEKFGRPAESKDIDSKEIVSEMYEALNNIEALKNLFPASGQGAGNA